MAALVPAVATLGLGLLLAGCGSGQITQTDTQVAGVNGASGTIGAMAVRSAELAFPPNSAQGVYQPGSNATLIVTIVNTGITSDTLVGISTPAADGVTIDGSPNGTKVVPGGFAVRSGMDVDGTDTTAGTTSATAPTATPLTTSATTTGSVPGTSGATASAPSGTTTTAPSTTAAPALSPSTVQIVLTGIKEVNGAPLRSGLTIPITFSFAHAGQVTVAVPIGAPPDNASYPTTAGANG